MKILLSICICLCLIGCNRVEIVAPPKVEEKEEEPSYEGKRVNVYVFFGEGCPHCEHLLNFFENIDAEYKDYFEIKKYEIWYDIDNYNLMKKVANSFGDDAKGVPYYIIGDETFKGYNASFDNKIKDTLKSQYYNESAVDIMDKIDS